MTGGLKGLDGRWRRATAGFVIVLSMRLMGELPRHAGECNQVEISSGNLCRSEMRRCSFPEGCSGAMYGLR